MSLRSIGSRTKYGRIAAIGTIQGERYYWIIDRYETVSMLPADVVEGREYLVQAARSAERKEP